MVAAKKKKVLQNKDEMNILHQTKELFMDHLSLKFFPKIILNEILFYNFQTTYLV